MRALILFAGLAARPAAAPAQQQGGPFNAAPPPPPLAVLLNGGGSAALLELARAWAGGVALPWPPPAALVAAARGALLGAAAAGGAPAAADAPTCAGALPWLLLPALVWLALCARCASAAAHWATAQEPPSLLPLRDDALALLGRGAALDGHVMHVVAVGGVALAWAASGGAPGAAGAALRWLLAYGCCLALRGLCVRATLLPDPAGAGAPPVAKSALLRLITHPAATRHDMLPSGHLLVVGVTAVLAPAARARPLAAAAWVLAAAAATLVARAHYSVDVVVGAALGALIGHAAHSAALPCGL